MTQDSPRPRDVTVVRVLLVLTGFGNVVNGLLEQNPAYPVSTRVFGWLLVAFGVGCWGVTVRLRRPGRRVAALVVAVVLLLVAIRIYQVVRFGTLAPAAGLVLPLLVYWRMRKPLVREWLAQDGPMPPRIRPGGPVRRTVAAFGAVGITVAALVVVTGAGTAVAVWPCSFPQAQTGGLEQDQNNAAESHVAPSGQFTATDGVPLAYYASVPANPVASLVFYHGSGANSAAGYLQLGTELAARYHVATYLVDIRGHGTSGGPRGDAPTPEQVWQDTDTVVEQVRRLQPKLPEFVGGHSAGAGLVLNSMDRVNALVAGYVFLAPDFGLHSGTEAVADASNFATVCQRVLIANAVTNGVLDGHAPALNFAYTTEQAKSANLVSTYTVNMALAQNANDSAAILRGMTKPLGVWIGAQDEVFDAAKVVAYARQAGSGGTFATVPHANHLGILTTGAEQIGPWITAHAR
ncbi:lysophospholipase [Amycolatopsis sp. NBC_00345]|uniref:alpha/beta fold hydrolase n=1 Tax=Amycolatopsis sp. NBC_00345 TaxID=2975955 RepID=UPI002E2655A4